MKRMLGIVAACAALVLPLRPLTAHASSVDDCQALITSLSAATSATVFTDSKQADKSQSQLLHHLDQASKNLTLGDLRGAAQEIKGYLNVLEDAVSAGRITADAAAPLETAANDIATCIASIQ